MADLAQPAATVLVAVMSLAMAAHAAQPSRDPVLPSMIPDIAMGIHAIDLLAAMPFDVENIEGNIPDENDPIPPPPQNLYQSRTPQNIPGIGPSTSFIFYFDSHKLLNRIEFQSDLAAPGCKTDRTGLFARVARQLGATMPTPRVRGPLIDQDGVLPTGARIHLSLRNWPSKCVLAGEVT